MSADVAVLVFVTVGHAATPAATSMLGAAQQMLGPGARITVETVEQIPPDDDVVLLADMTGLDAIVEITWPADNFHRANVRLWPRVREQWVERDLTFAPTDTPAERGRTVGFTFAAMIPDRPAPEPGAASIPGPLIPSPPLAPPPAARPGPTPPLVVDARERTIRMGSRMGGLEATGTFALAGPVSLLGAGLAGRWSVERAWSVRFGVDWRTGVAATTRVVDLRVASVGVARDVAVTRRLGLSARGEVVLLRETIARSAVDVVDERSRFFVGAAVLGDVVLELAPWLDALFSLGGEVIAGQTRIFVNDQIVGRLPPARLVTAVGLRLRF